MCTLVYSTCIQYLEGPGREILKFPHPIPVCLSVYDNGNVLFPHCYSKTHSCISWKPCRYLHHVMGVCCVVFNNVSFYVPPGMTGGTLCFRVVRPSITLYGRALHCVQCSAKVMTFQQTIMHEYNLFLLHSCAATCPTSNCWRGTSLLRQELV